MQATQRRSLAAIAAALLIVTAIAPTAAAAMLARALVRLNLSVVSWSAVVTSAGGSAATGPYALVITGVDKNGREGLFDIVNTGSSSITGFTLTASASSGIAAGTGVVYDLCSVPWSSNSNAKTYSCSGTTTTLASSTTADAVMPVTMTMASGARLSVRASCSAVSKTTTVSQTLSLHVARSQAKPKANR